MKSFNLIPRKPFTERFFWVIFSTILLFLLTIAVTIYYLSIEIKTTSKQQMTDLEAIKQEIFILNQNLLKKDPLTLEYEKFEQAVNMFQLSETKWTYGLDLLTEKLPNRAEIKKISSENDIEASGEVLSVRIEFAKLKDVSLFVEELFQDEKVKDIIVNEIRRTSKTEIQTEQEELAESTRIVNQVVDVFMTVMMTL